MLFASYEFIGYIMLVFLLYYMLPTKYQWKWLLIASYIFYFVADPVYLIYIMVTTVTVFFLGCRIEDSPARGRHAHRVPGVPL